MKTAQDEINESRRVAREILKAALEAQVVSHRIELHLQTIRTKAEKQIVNQGGGRQFLLDECAILKAKQALQQLKKAEEAIVEMFDYTY